MLVRKLTIGAALEAVDAQERVALADLTGPHSRHGADGVQARVLGQCHGNGLQGVRKGSHCVLLQSGNLFG